MIEREGSYLASVGACLCIDKSFISEVEKDESCPKFKDKIHQILSQWQWKNTGKATWVRLIKCLEALDEQNLMKDIQAYLSQKEGMMVIF